MYICTLRKSQVLRCYMHVAQFLFRIHDVSCTITSEPWKSEKQTAVANSTAFAWCLARLAILGLCSEGTWTATSPHDTAKGVACETRSEPPPSPASMAVGSTPRAKRTCLLTLMIIRNATSPCSHFCCTNNRIIISFLQTNWSTKISIFCQKRGVYELLGCTNY